MGFAGIGVTCPRLQLTQQIGELAARLREAQAEREALGTTAKTVRAMAADLCEPATCASRWICP